jgi:hypothetical protein
MRPLRESRKGEGRRDRRNRIPISSFARLLEPNFTPTRATGFFTMSENGSLGGARGDTRPFRLRGRRTLLRENVGEVGVG